MESPKNDIRIQNYLVIYAEKCGSLLIIKNWMDNPWQKTKNWMLWLLNHILKIIIKKEKDIEYHKGERVPPILDMSSILLISCKYCVDIGCRVPKWVRKYLVTCYRYGSVMSQYIITICCRESHFMSRKARSPLKRAYTSLDGKE